MSRDRPESPSPRRGARWAFALLTGLLLVALGELGGAVAFRLGEGWWPSPSALRSLRAATLAEAGSEVAPSAAVDATVSVATSAGLEVLHPFLGFVLDPAFSSRQPAGAGLGIDEDGLLRPLDAWVPRADDVVVGVLGGSAAVFFARDAAPLLAAALAAREDLAGRRIVVLPLALGGYKQPQQLLLLTYLLARGRRFDILINLDGFNEVALGARDAYARGVAFEYPRSWDGRVAGLATARERRLMARAEVLRWGRRRWAEGFSRAVVGRSMLAALLWRRVDRRLAAAAAEVERERRLGSGDRAGFQTTGPFRSFASDEALFAAIARSWAEASLQLHRLATANGIAYFHFLQPNQYVPDSKPMTAAERAVAFVEGSPHRPSVEAGYPHLRREGKRLVEAGVRFRDLSRVFAAHPEPLYVDACCHVAAAGNAILAAEVVAALELPRGVGSVTGLTEASPK